MPVISSFEGLRCSLGYRVNAGKPGLRSEVFLRKQKEQKSQATTEFIYLVCSYVNKCGREGTHTILSHVRGQFEEVA